MSPRPLDRIRKLSLRTKFYGIILPLLIVLVLPLAAIALPYVGVQSEVNDLRGDVLTVVEAKRFLRALDNEILQYAELGLSLGEPLDLRDLENAHGEAQGSLDRLLVLLERADADEADRSAAAVIGPGYLALQESGVRVLDRARAADSAGFRSAMRHDLETVAARVHQAAHVIAEKRIQTVDDHLFKLSGRDSALGSVIGSKWDARIGATRTDLAQVILAEDLSGHVSEAILRYADFAVSNDTGIDLVPAVQAHGRADDDLAAWSALRNASAPGDASSAEALRPVKEQVARFDRFGELLLVLMERSQVTRAGTLIQDEMEMLNAGALRIEVDHLRLSAQADLAVHLTAVGTMARHATLLLSLAAIVATTIAIGSPVLLSRSLVRPILDLRKTATRVGAGELAARARITAEDELGALGTAFNTMLDDLQASNAQLVAALADVRTKERALFESEERLRQLAENVAEVFWVATPDLGRILYVNPAYAALWGRSRDALLARPDEWTDGVHADDRERIMAERTRQVHQGLPFILEYRIVRPDGTVRWVEDRGIPVRDETDQVRRFVGVTTDVTDRREELRIREERLRSVVTASPVIIFALDREGIYTLAQGRPLAELGLDASRILGRRPEQAYPDRPEITAHVRRALQGEAFAAMETLAGRTFETRYSPLRGPRGEPAGALGVAVDVTERLRAQAAELLAHKQLLEIEHLKQIGSFKTQLLNTASHELSTPITPLIVQVHLLKTAKLGPLTDEQRHAIDMLDRNLQRLTNVVKEMLDAVRIQSGRLKLQKTRADVGVIVAETVETYQAPAHEAHLALAVALEVGLSINADPDRLFQVFHVLLDNAIKFTPPGGRVDVAARRVPDGVRIEVRDTGRGIAADQIARIFQPFAQVHDDMQITRGGPGLGLYITKAIVEQHGGQVWAESEGLGRGCVFVVTLPTGGSTASP